jgi:hypothetical protein
VGPVPPTEVTAGVGENIILMTWTPATDATIEGYNIYCEAQGSDDGDAALVDGEAQEATLVCQDSGTAMVADGAAEASSAGGTDAGACTPANVIGNPSASGASCSSKALVDSFCLVNGVSVPVDSCPSTTTVEENAGEAGIVPVETDAETGDTSVPVGSAIGISNIPSIYLCGQTAGNISSRFTVEGFSNGGPGIQDGTRYAVGVAAVDGEGNTGLISSLACVTPARVMTFWDLYVMDGGMAGGGFCALEGPGIPVGTSLFGIGTGAAALTYVRRRRRSR